MSCRSRAPKTTHRLITVSEGGEEVTTARVGDDGLLVGFDHNKPGTSPRGVAGDIALLESVLDDARRRELQPVDGQLVLSWGSMGCGELNGCFAFRSRGRSYLASPDRPGAIFRLETDEGPLSHSRDITSFGAHSMASRARRGETRHFMGLGGDRYVWLTELADGEVR